MKDKKSVKAGMSSGTWLVLGISVIYILFGLGMLLIDELSEQYIIYIAAAVLIVYGAVLIIMYFISKAYKEIGKYGFSAGAVSALAGICMLIRAEDIMPYLSLFFGICILCTAVIKLQNALDMKCIKSKGWIPFLVLAAVFVAAAMVILTDPGSMISSNSYLVYVVLIADGAASILTTIFLFFAIRISKKRVIRQEEQAAQEAQEAERKAAFSAASTENEGLSQEMENAGGEPEEEKADQSQQDQTDG